jgi:hypothetical protein
LVSPALHTTAQIPEPLQVCPLAHALPHAPQLFESVLVDTQLPLQTEDPEAQAQAPLVHVAPLAQAAPGPQNPQLDGLLW